MALVACAVEWPTWFPQSGLAAGTALDGTGEQFAYIVQVPKTGTISKVGFRTVAVTTSDSLSVGLYTVDDTGTPTATAYGGMAAGTQASVSAATSYWVTLGTAATATMGDLVAIVVSFTSYDAGNLTLAVWSSATGEAAFANFPTTRHYAPSTWAAANHLPCVWLEYSDGSYAPIAGVWPIFATATVVTLDTGQAVDEAGVYIASMPFKARCVGANVSAAFATTSSDCDVILYDASDSVLASFRMEGNYPRGVTPLRSYVAWASAVTLTAGSAYRLVLKPTGTADVNLTVYDATATAQMAAMPHGVNMQYTARADAGAWTNTNTRTTRLSLLFDQMDDGTGSSGAGAWAHRMIGGGF